MILAIIQARFNSSRLPGKVLKTVNGIPLLEVLYSRLSKSTLIDKIVLATSVEKSDDVISIFANKANIDVFRGSLNNVLDRYYQCSNRYKAKHMVRITGDCPLIDPFVVDKVINSHLNSNADYTSNVIKPTYPDGLDVEILKCKALEKAWLEAELPSEKEHVTRFFYNNPNFFKLNNVQNTEGDFSNFRWVVDEQEDFEVIRFIIEKLYENNPIFSWKDVLSLYDNNSNNKILSLNKKFVRNSGLHKSLLQEKAAYRRIYGKNY